MTPDDLDRILSSEDVLEPSSNLAVDVMAAVCRPAEPPARTFPWLRFAAGLAASVTMAAAGTVLLPRSAPVLAPVAARLAPLAAFAPDFGYAAAAMLVSLGVAAIPWLRARS
jgi:hypothetical protein